MTVRSAMRRLDHLLLAGGLVALLLSPAAAGEPRAVVLPWDLLGSPGVEQDTEAGVVHADSGVVRMVSRSGSPEFWRLSVTAPTNRPVSRGDVALVSFRARCLECPFGGEGTLDVYFQRATGPWEKSLHVRAAVTREWAWHHYPFVVGTDLAAGRAQLGFGAARQPQVVEISHVTVYDYGPDQDLEALPSMRPGFARRDADAGWRKEAEARIEEHRKADLRVRVRDAAGRPVPGATVRVRMTRHAFRFGTTVAVPALTAKGPDGERYRAEVRRLFNHVSIENALKWPVFAEGGGQGSPAARARTRESLRRLREGGLSLHGHVLVWPGWRNCPPALRDRAGEPARLRAEIDAHIAEMMAFTRGLADEWDVVNEPLGNTDLTEALGAEEMVRWFRLARRADPGVRLYLNERGLLNEGTRSNDAHQDRLVGLVRFLLERGAPVDGVGVQAHFAGELTPPAEVVRDLDRLAVLGLPLQVTELDVVCGDEERQADYTRDFLTAAFSHEAVNGICLWGFWEGRIWNRAAALWRRDWTRKPNGKVYEDLVLRRWWTDEEGRAGPGGDLRVRGFLGRYEVTVRAGEGRGRAEAVLGKRGAAVTVVME